MYAKLLTVTTVTWLLIASVGLAKEIETNSTSGRSKEEVLEMLPIAIDLHNHEAFAQYRQLLAMGDKVYPVLRDILAETNDAHTVGAILAVFIESSGDKSIPIAAVKELLSRRKHEGWHNTTVRMDAAHALSRISRPEDKECLYGLLDDEEERIRLSALKGILRLGKAEDIERLNEFIGRRKQKLNSQEWGKDRTVIDVAAVLCELESRSGGDCHGSPDGNVEQMSDEARRNISQSEIGPDASSASTNEIPDR